MFLKFGPYMWMFNIYSKLIDCILIKIIVQYVCFVKGIGTSGSRERNVIILLSFQKSPRFPLTLPFSQLREKSSRDEDNNLQPYNFNILDEYVI